jgi:hypothetical protein
VVPATNFTSAFSKLGYIGIKKIIDNADYSKKTIVQAAHLKLQIKSLRIKKDKHTIYSLDIEAFYLLVTYALVERAIDFFSISLGETDISSATSTVLTTTAIDFPNTYLFLQAVHTLLLCRTQHLAWHGMT